MWRIISKQCEDWQINWVILQGCYTRGLFWFRLFGFGIHIKDRRLHQDLYSGRNGFVKRLKIGWLVIKPLGRDILGDAIFALKEGWLKGKRDAP
jgi:hypothetical protein